MNSYSGIEILLHNDLTKLIETMMNFADFIDNNYHKMENNNLMRHWQDKGVTLKSIVLTDLLDWLCCLAFSDGFIADKEVEFINTHLKQEFFSRDVIDLCKFRINQDYFNHLPLSFILLYENDLIMKSNELQWDFNSVEHLFTLFMIMGVHFIHCDGKIDVKELDMLNEYTKELSNRIYDFNLIQNQLTVLESSCGKYGDNYSEERYPFNQDVLNNYREELNELDNLEDVNEEKINDYFSSEININTEDKDDNIQNNFWQGREINTNYSWNLEKNINAYYDFTGEFDNHLADIGEIITVENCQKLKNTHLTAQQYRSILNKIKSTSDNVLYKIFNENYVDFNSMDIFEKILLFTKTFVDADYKSSGEELGVYSFNRIHLDDRYDSAIQITTLIHELSHHLLAEIFEQAAMILLNTDKTDALELYVNNSLGSSKCFILLNEYCAHLVEVHFTPPEYQNYASFLKCLEEFDLSNDKDKQIVFKSIILGNTFCKDILYIIESFIDNKLREEIKQQFKEDINLEPVSIEIPFDETCDINFLLEFINHVFLTGLNESLKNHEA